MLISTEVYCMLVLIHMLHRTFVASLTYILIETHRHAVTGLPWGPRCSWQGIKGSGVKGGLSQPEDWDKKLTKQKKDRQKKRKKKKVLSQNCNRGDPNRKKLTRLVSVSPGACGDTWNTKARQKSLKRLVQLLLACLLVWEQVRVTMFQGVRHSERWNWLQLSLEYKT